MFHLNLRAIVRLSSPLGPSRSAWTHAAQHPLQALLTVGLFAAGGYLLSRSGLLAGLDDAVRARFSRGGAAEVDAVGGMREEPAAVDDAWLRPSTVGAGAADSWSHVE